ASANRLKRGVTRSIEERDLFPALLYLVSADMLSNPARFAGNDIRLPDIVDQRGFSMVDVTENTDHRRARFEKLAFIDLFRLLLFLFTRSGLFAAMAHIEEISVPGREIHGHVFLDRLVHGGENIHLHELRNQLERL